MNAPKLRFLEFTDKWQTKKSGDLIEKIESGVSVNSEDRPRKNGEFGILKTSAVAHGFFYPNENKAIPLVELSRAKLHPQKDTIVVSRMNTPQLVGESGYVDRTYEDLYIPDRLWCVTVNERNNAKWLSYVLASDKMHSDLSSVASGTSNSMKNIAQSSFLNLKVITPKKVEQQKIANFLTVVDEKIVSIDKKIELLKQYKKAVMQKVFTQQIRFKDNDGRAYLAWQNKRLGDVLKIGSGRDYKHLKSGNIPVYGTGGLMLYVDNYLHEGKSIGIGRKGTIDKPQFLNGKFWTVDTLFYTYGYKDSVPEFLYVIFQNINWLKHNEASGVPSLAKTTIEKIKIDVPSMPEQQKIANFLELVDDKIRAEEAKLTHSKQFKGALLQRMFV